MTEEKAGTDWKIIVSGILVLGVVLAGVFLLASTGGETRSAGTMPAGMMMMNSDRMFIEEMIPHHEDAVKMGELALVRAGHPELRQLAENIIRDQSREIDQMRAWYREWYGVDVPAAGGMAGRGRGMMGAGAGMGGMGMDMTDLAALGNATEFDREFIRQMIPHHRMAVRMAQMMTQNSDHAEIRQLGNSIIRTQSAEVEQMTEWYRTWYGVDPPA